MIRQKNLKLIGVVTLAALFAAELDAQRPRRTRRPRPTPTAPAKPAEKPAEKKKVENYVAITGGTVYVGTGQIIHRATVLVGDDKIEKVGPGIDIPKGAKIIDATGKYVSPGFVIVQGRGMGAGSATGNPKDSVNPFDPQIKMGLAAGITSFLMTGGSGTSSPGGSSAVFKLAYGDLDGMVLMHGNVLKMSVPLTMARMKAFRDLNKKAEKYKKDKAAFDAKKDKKPTDKPPKAAKGVDNILAIRAGEKKLWIGCRRGFDNDRIRQALTIARLLGVGVVLVDPTTAWSIPDEVAASGSMVILNPRENVRPDPARPDTTGSNIAMARILDAAGIPVAVHPPAGRFGGGGLGTGGILGQDLNTPHVDAAFAVRGGLDNRKALRTITLDAAATMGAQARIGSLEAGKDADILILDGQPLHYRTFVETAIVNGKVVYEKAKEPFYNHIVR